MNWLQTNGVNYLPVAVKGRGNVRRGLPANTTHSPNAGTILCQRADRDPTMYQHWVNVSLFATSLVGKACLPNTLTGLRLKIRSTARELYR